MITRILMIVGIVLCLFMCVAAECWAWLWDGGIAQHAAAVVKEGGGTNRAAAPIKIGNNAMIIRLGAAMAKFGGPLGEGYDVYLTPDYENYETTALTVVKMVPLNMTLTYYYYDLPEPVRVRGDLKYYMVFVPTATDFAGSISYSVRGYYGIGSSNGGNSWYYMSYPLCVRADGYIIPEPGSIGALAVFCILCGVFRRSR